MEAFLFHPLTGNDDLGLDRNRPTLSMVMSPGDILVLREGDKESMWQCHQVEIDKVILQRVGVPDAESTTS
jgi:hypothetical protein